MNRHHQPKNQLMTIARSKKFNIESMLKCHDFSLDCNKKIIVTVSPHHKGIDLRFLWWHKHIISLISPLYNFSGSTKDKLKTRPKCIIYKLLFKNCNQIYIEHAKRASETRYKKHVAHFRLGRIEFAATAQNLIKNGHHMEQITFNWIKIINSPQELETFTLKNTRKWVRNCHSWRFRLV